jgi:hypothetical protein
MCRWKQNAAAILHIANGQCWRFSRLALSVMRFGTWRPRAYRQAFDKVEVGQPEPSHRSTPTTQSPIILRNKKSSWRILQVTTQPRRRDRKDKRSTGFSDLEGDVTVKAGKGFASSGWLVSPAPVPNKVDCQDAWKIDWTYALGRNRGRQVQHTNSTCSSAIRTVGHKLLMVDMSCGSEGQDHGKRLRIGYVQTV